MSSVAFVIQRTNSNLEVVEKEVRIYDAIEITVKLIYSPGEAEAYFTDLGKGVAYYNDEIGVLAGGVSKGFYGKSKEGLFEFKDRYSYGVHSVIDEYGNPSTTGGYALPQLKYDYIRAWATKPDDSNAYLNLTVIRRQVYEKEGSRYENVTILGSDSTARPYGRARVECYPEYIELPETLKNGRLVAEMLWNRGIEGVILVWHGEHNDTSSKELMITFRREYRALGGTILNPYDGGIPTDFLERLLERPGVYVEFLGERDFIASSYINPTLTNLGWSPSEPDEYSEDNIVILFIGFDQKLIEQIDLDLPRRHGWGDHYPTLRKLSIFSFDSDTTW